MRRNQLGKVVWVTLALTAGALLVLGSDTWAGKGGGGGPGGGETTYSVFDLGTLGGIDSYAGDINDYGQIAGAAETGEVYLDPAGNVYRIKHAVRWDPEGIVDLGLLGGAYSGAAAINNSGQAAGTSHTGGTYLDSSGNVHLIEHAVRWDETGIVDLGTLGGWNSSATDINDWGQVVGWSWAIPGSYERHAFLWDNGVMIGLGTLPGGPHSLAHSINNWGQVVGEASTATGLHAFLWLPEPAYGLAAGMHDLGTLGGAHSKAMVITDEGDIYGTAQDAGNWPEGIFYGHLTRWEPDGQGGFTVTDLGTLQGKKTATPYAAAWVGSTVQVVGSSCSWWRVSWGAGGWAIYRPADCELFLWQDGQWTNIHRQVADNGGFSDLFAPGGINSGGEFVGTGTTDGTDRRGYLAIPGP